MKGNKVDAIIDAAAMLIQQNGVAQTSISDIVRASGTSAGAIYHHFPNKNAVVVAVAKTALIWPMSALEDYRHDPASPAELLEYALDALDFAPELGKLLVALGAGAAVDDELGSDLRDVFQQLRASVDLTMEAWAEANDVLPERIAGYSQLMMGLAVGYATQHQLLANFDAEGYKNRAIAIMTLGPDSAPDQPDE